MSLRRTLDTVRHLRRGQIAAQLSHRVRRAWEDPSRLLASDAPTFTACAWRPVQDFLPPVACRQNPAMAMASGRLEFLGKAVDIGWPPEWDRADLPRLWQYNLHYFDYLHALGWEDARRVALDWIVRHGPARQRVGWEPYPTSLRLMNWCMVFFGRFRTAVDEDADFRQQLWTSINHQSRWLEGHLETHLLGNHLLENAAALVTVGSCFEGPAARGWLQEGMDLLAEQLSEQILPDGGHSERSPMYHARVVYVLALLRNIGADAVTRLVAEPLARTVTAMKHMTHPDGGIGLFNDSAFEVYNTPGELAAYVGEAGPLAPGSFALPQTGYFGARTAEGTYVICDAGAIGPDHQPGHAHGDMLSFELSLRGHRVVADSGVYDYEPGEMRAYCRSTRAHNTVEVDAQDQCEFWGTFRVGRRGHVHDVQWSPLADGFRLRAWHDGYRRLPGRPSHQRTFRWYDRGTLVIRDVIRSGFANRFVARIHLDPRCHVVELKERAARIQHDTVGVFCLVAQGEGALRVEEGRYCPTFGAIVRTEVIAWEGAVGPRGEEAFTLALGDESVGECMDPEK